MGSPRMSPWFGMLIVPKSLHWVLRPLTSQPAAEAGWATASSSKGRQAAIAMRRPARRGFRAKAEESVRRAARPLVCFMDGASVQVSLAAGQQERLQRVHMSGEKRMREAGCQHVLNRRKIVPAEPAAKRTGAPAPTTGTSLRKGRDRCQVRDTGRQEKG